MTQHPSTSLNWRWHWDDPGFDDLEIQRLVEQAVELGRAQWPRWTWPIPGPYNGHTGEQRIWGWQRVWLAVRLGLLPKPQICSICKTRNDRIQYHNECYERPLQAKPVCQSCHKIIHTRFRAPESWLQLVAQHSRRGHRQWFEDVAMHERTAVGDQRIVTVTVMPKTKGIQARVPTAKRVSVRHRQRKPTGQS